jgi:hypothetical protein
MLLDDMDYKYKNCLYKQYIPFPLENKLKICYCCESEKNQLCFCPNGTITYLCEQCAKRCEAEILTDKDITIIMTSNKYLNIKSALKVVMRYATLDQIQTVLNEIVIEDVIK